MDFPGITSTRDMATKATWDAPRWRRSEEESYLDKTQSLQSSSLRGFHAHSQNASVESYSNIGGPLTHIDDEQQAHNLPSPTDPSTRASAYHSGLRERNTPPTDGLDGPQKLPNFSSNVSPWLNQGSENSSDRKDRQPATVPLTLQIPLDQGKYMILPMLRE